MGDDTICIEGKFNNIDLTPLYCEVDYEIDTSIVENIIGKWQLISITNTNNNSINSPPCLNFFEGDDTIYYYIHFMNKENWQPQICNYKYAAILKAYGNLYFGGWEFNNDILLKDFCTVTMLGILANWLQKYNKLYFTSLIEYWDSYTIENNILTVNCSNNQILTFYK